MGENDIQDVCRVHLFFNMPSKVNQLGYLFLIFRKFKYVREIWESLKEILSSENSNLINGNPSNAGVDAVYLDVILHFGC